MLDNDIDGVLDLTFSTDDERFGETVTIDLKPNGRNIEVTNENKKEYIEYVFSHPFLLKRRKRMAY
jgi:E3 ubiquitin-protein ligase NEDD4